MYLYSQHKITDEVNNFNVPMIALNCIVTFELKRMYRISFLGKTCVIFK